jgi:hypothetical protein
LLRKSFIECTFLELCGLVVKGTQLWTKESASSKFQIPVTFSGEIADLVQSLHFTAGEDPVPEQGSMQAIGSPGQVLLT